MFKIKEVLLEEEKNKLISFLHKNNLEYEFDIDYSILVYDGDELVATSSIANNVMKCFLVRNDYKNKNITTLMFHHLENILKTRGMYNFFVYTSPNNEKVFTSLNMKKIVETMNTVLLEGGDFIKNVLHELKLEYNISNNKKAAVIINANPMTLGHVYLIETAAKENKEVLVFVVSEDLSSFPFKDRIEIIKDATKHLDNVTVLPTLSYLVSKITFPKYFLKEDQLIQEEQTLVDVLVYKQYYKPIFNIEKRYLGDEPFSFNTSKYNQVLKDYLNSHIKIIPRKEKNNKAISASLVRKLIKANKIEKIKDYVPLATYNYLTSQKGEKIVEEIQNKKLGRH
ncbi:[Citrate [pro-3S]-lyase] ligase [Candidatus Izimaplasma bacterium HR1]|jgi:[citrate (pro-3S)-lyase] ligase|uniref:adenylyltransferase/cytidyltransferase family protein n=1 Tax=Candidatus Izimoplasma sp. HR1 TaxID=1541959 RepID=UPI0004F7DEE2|nr:[Citrate [pro-3S]-lyase] ligase [Candidatus Izimaplasma bacterium HR1]